MVPDMGDPMATPLWCLIWGIPWLHIYGAGYGGSHGYTLMVPDMGDPMATPLSGW